MIRGREVSVIGDDGEPLGVIPTEEAIRIAEDQDLDQLKLQIELQEFRQDILKDI